MRPIATGHGGSRHDHGEPAALMQRARRTSGLAVASLVCGVLPYLGLFPAGIMAIFLGHAARRRIRRTGVGGSRLAQAGLILGYFSLAGIVAAIVALTIAYVATPVPPVTPVHR
jgi:hypothetical protein